MNLFIIKRENVLEALACGQLIEANIVSVGPIWVTVRLTEKQRANFRFPIAKWREYPLT